MLFINELYSNIKTTGGKVPEMHQVGSCFRFSEMSSTTDTMFSHSNFTIVFMDLWNL